MNSTWWNDVVAADPAVLAAVLARMVVFVAVGGLPMAVGVGLRVQAAVAVLLAAASVPAAIAAAPSTAVAGCPLPFLIAAEALVGLVLGTAVAAVFAAASWAGGILGSVTGLSWADDFTPEGDPQTAGTARLAWWMALAGFLAAGGHEQLVAGIVDSVRSLPVGAAVGPRGGWTAGLEEIAATMPSAAITLAVSLAAPALAAVLAFHLVATICVRTVAFDPGSGLLQGAASLVLLVAVSLAAESWIGGFAAAVQPPLERCFEAARP